MAQGSNIFFLAHLIINMARMKDDKTLSKVRHRRVHMANERTFLAWIRTSIGIMAFGFVVERFGLFVKQLSYFLLTSGSPEKRITPPAPGYSPVLGVFLLAFGAVMGVLAFVRYKKVERQIDEDTYKPSLILDVLLVLSLAAVGIFLIIYLVHSL